MRFYWICLFTRCKPRHNNILRALFNLMNFSSKTDRDPKNLKRSLNFLRIFSNKSFLAYKTCRKLQLDRNEKRLSLFSMFWGPPKKISRTMTCWFLFCQKLFWWQTEYKKLHERILYDVCGKAVNFYLLSKK